MKRLISASPNGLTILRPKLGQPGGTARPATAPGLALPQPGGFLSCNCISPPAFTGIKKKNDCFQSVSNYPHQHSTPVGP